ncbi:MAG: cellulase family glycosylhydrolase [Breznakibacter sp.]
MKKIFFLIWIGALLVSGCKNDGDDSSDPDTEEPETPGSAIDFTAPIRGVNWADKRDNFVDDYLVPSGLTSGDSYYMVQADAQYVIKGFKENMSANTVRLPINYPTVSGTWWNGYKGAIDMAVDKGMRVILAYWEGASSRDGKVDNDNEFWAMWTKVVGAYADNPGVYFEVMNEPHGYALEALMALYEKWLSKYPSIPHGRILLGGTGYSEDVTKVGADSRFTNCLLSLHNYAFWATRSAEEWRSDWLKRIGDYASRTVVTEFGATMTQGKDYNSTEAGDNEIDYIQTSTSLFREYGIASVYWPGLRDDDWYTIQQLDYSTYKMSTTNASGLYRIQYGWGLNP